MQNQKSPVNIKEKEGMTPDLILEELTKRDVLVSDIAKALEVTPGHVSNVIRRKSSSYPVEKAVSLALNLNIALVFGTKSIPSRGRKPRTERRAQVVAAIRAGITVPSSA